RRPVACCSSFARLVMNRGSAFGAAWLARNDFGARPHQQRRFTGAAFGVARGLPVVGAAALALLLPASAFAQYGPGMGPGMQPGMGPAPGPGPGENKEE